jgi:hypothetical protein
MEEKNNKKINSKNMKAVLCPKYRPPEVIQIKEVPKPVPKDKEVMVIIPWGRSWRLTDMSRKGTKLGML